MTDNWPPAMTQPALKQRQRETHRALALLIVELVGVVEAFAHVVGDVAVKGGFLGAQRIIHRVGKSFREQRLAFHGHQLLLHHASHHVGDIRHMRAISLPAFEPVPVKQ